MTEIKDCLPEAARKYFIDLRNIRLKAETDRYQQRLTELRVQLAARGQGRSGWQEMEEWKYKEELSNALATGYIQDAIETCDLYGIPLTDSLCNCFVRAIEELINAQYQSALKVQAEGLSDVKIPLPVRQQGNLRVRQIMPQIRVMIEKARVECQKKALVENDKGKPGSNYTQNITQHGGVINTSQSGNVTTHQLAGNTVNMNDQSDAIKRARDHAESVCAGDAEAIAQEFQLKLDQEREQLAKRGLGTSSVMAHAQVRIECERIRAITQLHLNALLEGCEMYGVQVGDDLAKDFCSDILTEMNKRIDVAQKNILAGIPAATQSDYPQQIAQKIGNAAAWIKSQIDRRRLMPKKHDGDISGSTAQSSIVVHGDVTGSTFQQGNHNVAVVEYNETDIKKIIEEVKAQIGIANLSKESSDEVAADIGTVEAQLASPKPKHHIIRESLKSVRHILEHAMGAATAHAGLPLLMAYLHHGSK